MWKKRQRADLDRIWSEPADVAQLPQADRERRALAVAFAVSDNPGRNWDIEGARRLLGYEPQNGPGSARVRPQPRAPWSLDLRPSVAVDPFPFIVGVARSGTTLLRAVVDAHPEIAIPPESRFIPTFARQRDRYETAEGRCTDVLVW